MNSIAAKKKVKTKKRSTISNEEGIITSFSKRSQHKVTRKGVDATPQNLANIEFNENDDVPVAIATPKKGLWGKTLQTVTRFSTFNETSGGIGTLTRTSMGTYHMEDTAVQVWICG